MRIKKLIKLFNLGNVSITGLRGTGKDMLMANCLARKKQQEYISNIDYKIKGKKWINLQMLDFNINNDFNNFINGKINKYEYPYKDNIDIFISDAGTYFPSQYNGELDKKYKWFGSYIALSRQLGENNIHWNAQNINRVWIKLREQGDQYIYCKWCIVIFGKIVIEKIRIYERLESLEKQIPPFALRRPILGNKNTRMLWQIEKNKYLITYGKIREHILIYLNKSKYNTRQFKEILEKGE